MIIMNEVMNRLILIVVATLVVTMGNTALGQTSPIVLPGAELEKLPGDYRFTEGPAVDQNGNIYFTDQPEDRILRWDAGTRMVEEWLKPSGRSNGLYLGKDGSILACADEKNQLWRIAPDKSVTVLVENYKNQLLNGPNDLWVHPTGGIYFTDPLYPRSYWQRDPSMEQDGQHVYYLPPGESTPIRVAEGFRQPNGIVGSADGRFLYVADIGANKTYRFDIHSDGALDFRHLFCQQGSDGMTLDAEGNLYLTGRGVSVFSPEGIKIHQIDVPESWTANVAFGGKNHDYLFITASRSVYGLQMAVKGAMTVVEMAHLTRYEQRAFGALPDGSEVHQFILRNRVGMEVRLINYGATLTSIRVPDSAGNFENVIVGSEHLDDYLRNFPAASVIGRYANRIGGARFSIDGQDYSVTRNNAPHHIHGGRRGFARQLWSAQPLPNGMDHSGVTLRLRSEDGDEGFPGNLDVSVVYRLDDSNRLHIEYSAESDKPTVVNLTNHAYFNLAGLGRSSIDAHVLQIQAHAITEVDRQLIPTGVISPVAGTRLDFLEAKAIGRDMAYIDHPRAGMYDHNFILSREKPGVTRAATVMEPVSGRIMDVWTDLPGIQLFTGNPRGLCLETQHFPDAMNHPHFPSPIVRPQHPHSSKTIFAFRNR